jgi:hypothetical protein
VAEDGGGGVRELAFDDVEVAVTDTTGSDLDQHFSLARFRFWYILSY